MYILPRFKYLVGNPSRALACHPLSAHHLSHLCEGESRACLTGLASELYDVLLYLGYVAQ